MAKRIARRHFEAAAAARETGNYAEAAALAVRLRWEADYRLARTAIEAGQEEQTTLPDYVWDAAYHVRTMNDGTRRVMGDCLQAYGAMGPRFRYGRLSRGQQWLWGHRKQHPRTVTMRPLP